MIKSIQRGLLALIAVTAAAGAFGQAPPYSESGGPASFDTSSWTVDRYAPNGWTANVLDPTGGRSLRVHIDNADRRDFRSNGFDNSFYDTQGRTRINNFKATEVGGEVYIPLNWGLQGNLRQTALWSRDNAVIENEAYYPIISFINNDPNDPYNPNAIPQPRFRIWDSTTGWIDRTDIPVLYNQFNSFRIKDTGHSHQFFINGNMVAEFSGDMYSSAGNEGLKQIILNQTNFGNAGNESTLPVSSYDVYWRNVYASDFPTANDLYKTVDLGSSVDIAPFLIANASSPNNRPLFMDNWSQPDHGTLAIVAGRLRYESDTYSGPDTFTYTLTDAYGQTASATAHIDVQVAKPALLQLAPNVLTGGTSTSGTVTMDHSVATGTYQIALTSSDPSASVPAFLTISSGDTGSFPITTTQVLSETTVYIYASYNGKTVRKSLLLKPLKLLSAKIGPGSVFGGAADSTLTVKLEAAPTVSPVTVSVAGTNDAAADLDGATTVTFGVGQDTVSIPIDTHVVASQQVVAFTASLNGLDKSDNLVVRPVKLLNITADTRIIAPADSSTITPNSGTATVTLDHTLLPGESATVAITSAGGILSHPGSVTITGGSSTTFVYAGPATSLGYKAVIPLTATLGFAKFTNITVLKQGSH